MTTRPQQAEPLWIDLKSGIGVRERTSIKKIRKRSRGEKLSKLNLRIREKEKKRHTTHTRDSIDKTVHKCSRRTHLQRTS